MKTAIANTPRVSDTWLATYDSIVYTPEHRASDVLAIIQTIDEDAIIAPPNLMNCRSFTPKGYTRIWLRNVRGYKARDEVRGRLMFERKVNKHPATITVLPPPTWANVLYHPTMQPANVIALDPVDKLLAKRGARVVSVQEINPPVTPFYRQLIAARAQVSIAPVGIDNPHNLKPYTSIRLELAEARGWVSVARAAHPAHDLEFAAAESLILAAERAETNYWIMRLSSLATVLLDDLIKKLHSETKARVAA